MRADMDERANIQLTHAQVARQVLRLPICIVAHDIEAASNVGSLFRIADAFGVERLYLTGLSPAPPDPRIRKTARSTERAVSFEQRARAIDLVHELASDGYLIVSLELSTRSTDIRAFSCAEHDKLALIVGSENHGVSQELLDASAQTLHIPMCGQNSSLNLATACAIALFELTRELIPQ